MNSRPKMGQFGIFPLLSKTGCEIKVVNKWVSAKSMNIDTGENIPVMSWPMPTTPMTFPCSLRLVVAFNNTSIRAPAFVISGNSKLRG